MEFYPILGRTRLVGTGALLTGQVYNPPDGTIVRLARFLISAPDSANVHVTLYQDLPGTPYNIIDVAIDYRALVSSFALFLELRESYPFHVSFSSTVLNDVYWVTLSGLVIPRP